MGDHLLGIVLAEHVWTISTQVITDTAQMHSDELSRSATRDSAIQFATDSGVVARRANAHCWLAKFVQLRNTTASRVRGRVEWYRPKGAKDGVWVQADVEIDPNTNPLVSISIEGLPDQPEGIVANRLKWNMISQKGKIWNQTEELWIVGDCLSDPQVVRGYPGYPPDDMLKYVQSFDDPNDPYIPPPLHLPYTTSKDEKVGWKKYMETKLTLHADGHMTGTTVIKSLQPLGFTGHLYVVVKNRASQRIGGHSDFWSVGGFQKKSPKWSTQAVKPENAATAASIEIDYEIFDFPG